MAVTIEELIRVGGTRWQKAGRDRVYFNGPATWYGLETNRYNSGNISTASLDGEKISNGKAHKICVDLGYAKIWYDAADSRFHASGIDHDSQAYLDKIVGNIMAVVEKTRAEVTA